MAAWVAACFEARQVRAPQQHEDGVQAVGGGGMRCFCFPLLFARSAFDAEFAARR